MVSKYWGDTCESCSRSSAATARRSSSSACSNRSSGLAFAEASTWPLIPVESLSASDGLNLTSLSYLANASIALSERGPGVAWANAAPSGVSLQKPLLRLAE